MATDPQTSEQTSEYIETERRLVAEVFNEGNIATIDEIHTPDYVGHWYLPQGGEAGIDDLKEFVASIHEGFDDFRMDDEPTVADVTGTAHDEDMEATINEVYTGLREQYEKGRTEVLFAEIRESGGSTVETFLALLFLAHPRDSFLIQWAVGVHALILDHTPHLCDHTAKRHTDGKGCALDTNRTFLRIEVWMPDWGEPDESRWCGRKIKAIDDLHYVPLRRYNTAAFILHHTFTVILNQVATGWLVRITCHEFAGKQVAFQIAEDDIGTHCATCGFQGDILIH